MHRTTSLLHGSVVEEDLQLTTLELCRACRTTEAQIEVWVYEGVLQPSGASREAWRFGGDSLARMLLATRLMQDLEINAAGVALALELLERISELESRLGR
jgi:chaperone modulatory protein CbpM